MIYVDPLRRVSDRERAACAWRRKHYCHLFADGLDELHSFAQKLGLKRSAFVDVPGFPHYDLTRAIRARALAQGATEGSLVAWLESHSPTLLFKPKPHLQQTHQQAMDEFRTSDARFTWGGE